MYKINKRGQSTVEYVLLVAAVIAVMIAFTTKPNSGIQGELNTTLNAAVGQMSELGGRLSASQQGSNGTSPVSNFSVNPTTNTFSN